MAFTHTQKDKLRTKVQPVKPPVIKTDTILSACHNPSAIELQDLHWYYWIALKRELNDPLSEHPKQLSPVEVLRNELMTRHLGMVYKALQNKGVDTLTNDDLVEEAIDALMRTLPAYDPSSGYKFSTYYFKAVYRGIWRQGKKQTTYKSRYTLLQPEDVTLLEKHEKRSRHDIFGTPMSYEETWDMVKAHCTEIEQRVLYHRFLSENKLKLHEIGVQERLSKERIRQIEREALRKLREHLTSEHV